MSEESVSTIYRDAEIESNAGLIVEETRPITDTSIKKEVIGTTIEELVFRFCADYLEYPERAGELPEKYSNIDFDSFVEMVHLPENYLAVAQKLENFQKLNDNDRKVLEIAKQLIELQAKERMNQVLTDTESETLRIVDAAKSVYLHRRQTVEIHSPEDLHNPLGEIGNVTLMIFSDLHHAPSSLDKGVREQAFERYVPQRVISRLIDKSAGGKVFSEVEGDLIENSDTKGIDNVNKRYIFREAAAAQFREWLGRVIKSGKYAEGNTHETKPILVTLGDNVQDGAFLLDQLAENSAYREMVDENHTPIIEINGNHDIDSRIPESITMLSELYGHRVFTQEVAGGVLIAGIDTNIENPEWIKQFVEKAGPFGAELIQRRQEMQQMVLDTVRAYDGPVVLMGHNPARIVETLAINDDLLPNSNILQNSNIQCIIAGHTHNEKHVNLPIKNKKGEPIVMHVVESYLRVKGGKPEPLKMYALDIKDVKIGDLRTTHEPEDAFVRGVESRM